MTPAERTAKIAELRAEADRLEREGERNWPEDLEGQIFAKDDGFVYLYTESRNGPDLVIIKSGRGARNEGTKWMPGLGFDGDERFFTHLGHARDLITIKAPDAPEPTGAELVGKVCDFSDNGVDWTMGSLWTGKRGGDPRICTGFSPDTEIRYHSANCAWKYARLYREDRP